MAKAQDVPIRLGDRDLLLRYSYKATIALKELWGFESERDVQARMAEGRMDDFKDILWAGLRSHHPELSVEAVVDLLDDAGAEGMTEAVDHAITAAAPPEGPRQGQGKKPASR